ncbi:hypothetical protein N7489_003714 [Penicillium chrysogenum]|jgi:hypothetical protein|nr:uncharacterized protein N7489_003714 [Penicillium chrysogenum]XP_061068038.1 uncharacterized protein N7525_011562 [Penicillium rubens]KAJ5037803.1 hypothetical protein NUH16_011404 [Penicillium rubens]KAJ5243618.1 hypothetical protein N7489_003714 [Penicillium chrysogenum]KAJ5257390.1 hypothetical protein N7524_008946 [Penicillium chrysogenum]KAJ5260765.1 hypothetical protein N7505_009115 [Penicillium chrysogenum]KAJ5822278.1 hypothetical protein N7525_011562 [Penicillium rubens]
MTRFSANEKEQMKAGNRTAYVALPKNLKARRASKNDALNKHIWRTYKKLELEAVLQSGDSYFAVVLKTPENRDRALETLRAKKVRLDSEVVSLQVMPFGVPDEAANTVWTVRGWYGDTAEKIAGAIRT